MNAPYGNRSADDIISLTKNADFFTVKECQTSCCRM